MCQLATLRWPQMKTPHIEEDQTPFHNLIVQSLSKYCLSWFSHISVRFPSRGRHLSKYFFFDVLLQRNCNFYKALFVLLNITLNRILTIMYTSSILSIHSTLMTCFMYNYYIRGHSWSTWSLWQTPPPLYVQTYICAY